MNYYSDDDNSVGTDTCVCKEDELEERRIELIRTVQQRNRFAYELAQAQVKIKQLESELQRIQNITTRVLDKTPQEYKVKLTKVGWISGGTPLSPLVISDDDLSDLD